MDNLWHELECSTGQEILVGTGKLCRRVQQEGMHLELRSISFPELITSCNIEFFFQVQIIYLDEETTEFVVRATFDHPYPTTKIIWIPDSVSWSVYSLHSIL